MSGEERELRLAWCRHVGDGAVADGWLDTVLGHHRESSRHYHDLRHVRWVVHHGRSLATTHELTAAQIDRVVAAAFFHDAIYVPTRDDNEVASGRLARRALAEIGWAERPIDEVVATIEATAGHAESDDLPTAVLLAADLGVLAAEPSRYGDYARAVRREYAHLDDATWRRGRRAFIDATLDRDHIFPSALALDDWERRARANLTAERATLT